MMMLLAAYCMDLWLGDPPQWPHPVRWIGSLIQYLDRLLYRNDDPKRIQLIKGLFLALFVLAAVYGGAVLSVQVSRIIHPLFGLVVSLYLAYTTISAKALKLAAFEVMNPLGASDLPKARAALSMIVGRETAHLSETEITRATVETIAENFSDGIVAPLFYLFVGGVPAALAYKAVNTMDSMIGYQNERYHLFGRAAARLDDAANWLPARVSVLFIILAAMVCRLNWKNAWKIAKRDGRNHKSPNAGWPEAAAAGALNVQLGGSNVYFGQLVQKPTIGDSQSPLTVHHIFKSTQLLDWATFFCVLAFAILSSIMWGVY